MSSELSFKPTVAVAMMAGLGDYAFTPAHWDRLSSIAHLANREPLTDLLSAEAANALADADVLLGHWGCPTLTDDVLERATRLRLFAYAAGTVKWQVTDAVWNRGIVVTSAAAANAVPVAEYTVAMIVLANKGALLFRERMRDTSLQLPFSPRGVGNVAKRVGIVGASFVGRLVIEMLRAYSLDISVFDPYLTHEEATALGVDKVDDLVELCRSVDVLSIHAPDVEATRGMIGARELAALRDGATLINTARPALIDQDELETHLVAGRIAAILDVAEPDPLPSEHRLLTLPNVFVTPHIAGAMGAELSRMADLAITEIERFAAGQPPLHQVHQSALDRIA